MVTKTIEYMSFQTECLGLINFAKFDLFEVYISKLSKFILQNLSIYVTNQFNSFVDEQAPNQTICLRLTHHDM